MIHKFFTNFPCKRHNNGLFDIGKGSQDGFSPYLLGDKGYLLIFQITCCNFNIGFVTKSEI
jgi:hypothetical protein